MAAAAAVILAGALTPALAGTYSPPAGPSMTVNHRAVNIAFQGPRNSLRFYWAADGSATWHTETVAGAGSTFSTPSMAVNGNVVNIAAEGPDNTLRLFWAADGTSDWHTEGVPGNGVAPPV